MESFEHILREYDLSPETGFVPCRPLPPLPKPFTVWKDVFAKSHSLSSVSSQANIIAAEDWRTHVQANMPTLDILELKTLGEQRQAHLVLTYLASRYVHSACNEDKFLARCISRPLLDICRILDQPPVVSYTDLITWNWELIDPHASIAPDNLKVALSFTGTPDEDHFTLISLETELEGANCLHIVLQMLGKLKSLSAPELVDHLNELASAIQQMTSVMRKVRSGCRPKVFYNDIRPWFSGGLFRHEGLPEKQDVYGGGSAAQSVAIHSLDVFLGINHQDASTKEPAFLDGMLQYMPPRHRAFLKFLSEQQPSLRDSIQQASDMELTTAYNECLTALKKFREAHTQIVFDYIINPAREEAKL